jgi:hypothetical protein
MTINGTPSCGITYNCHSGDSRDIIYNCNIFIIQATGVTSSTPIHTFLMTISHMALHRNLLTGPGKSTALLSAFRNGLSVLSAPMLH